MEQKGTFQIGNIIMEGEIDMTLANIEVPESSKNFMEQLRAFTAKLPIWGPAELPKTVEGSLVEPITDEKRLIDETNS